MTQAGAYRRACAPSATDGSCSSRGWSTEDPESVVHLPIWGDDLPFLGARRATCRTCSTRRARSTASRSSRIHHAATPTLAVARVGHRFSVRSRSGTVTTTASHPTRLVSRSRGRGAAAVRLARLPHTPPVLPARASARRGGAAVGSGRRRRPPRGPLPVGLGGHPGGAARARAPGGTATGRRGRAPTAAGRCAASSAASTGRVPMLSSPNRPRGQHHG